MYNIESLIQRGNAQVSLNIVGGELTVALKAVDPTVADAEAVAIDRELLRDVQATLSNNNYPTTGYCEISDGDNDGELVITAPSNMPLAEGENLIVLSGVYCGAMFVQTYSVTGVAEGSATASAAITLNIIGSTPATPEPQEQIVTEGTSIVNSSGIVYNSTNNGLMSGSSVEGGKLEAWEHTGGAVFGEANDGNITASGSGAMARGVVSAGSTIQAEGQGALAQGHADDVSIIQTSGAGAIASGRAIGDCAIKANTCSIAVGVANSGASLEAGGTASQAFGNSTLAKSSYQMALGKFNVSDNASKYALIVGNGTSGDARSNAFAIGFNGSLYLFDGNGTPVELTPAKLATLVA